MRATITRRPDRVPIRQQSPPPSGSGPKNTASFSTVGKPECRNNKPPTVAKRTRHFVERVDDWRSELDWIRAAGPDGCLLFENIGQGRGAMQDALRRDGFNVIGSSAYGERLETDRGFAQQVLTDLDFETVPVFSFVDREAAIDHIEHNPARYVLKSNGPNGTTYVGRDAIGADVRALLRAGVTRHDSSFVLMEHVDGVEMGVGAYFDGERFLEPACLDWEHKRFFEGELGELTGEMGTVVTFDQTVKFFRLTLAKVEPLLREHGYCGYINLNTIVNERGTWPLEFTSRFGYPGYAILEPLQRTRWGDLFRRMIRREANRFDTESGFCVGIVITTPPFPYTRAQVDEPIGLPVLCEGVSASTVAKHLHYREVRLLDGMLVTTGANGYPLVVTGTGSSIGEACASANQLAKNVNVMNGRYRRDIGQRLIDGEYAFIQRLGLLG